MKISFKVKKNSEFISQYLTDMQKFTSVHPIISKIDSLGNNTYLFHETLTFAAIPFSFKYQTLVEERESEILMNANVLKLVKISITFEFIEEGEYTIVVEKVKFQTFLPIHFILKK
jgi:carbon monoxide dehydrogenase subunit G